MFINHNTPLPTIGPADIVSNMQENGAVMLRSIVAYAEGSLQRVWANPRGFSAQDILTAMGTNAASAIQQHGALVAFLASPTINAPVDPAVLALIKPFTVNPDGTVTINP